MSDKPDYLEIKIANPDECEPRASVRMLMEDVAAMIERNKSAAADAPAAPTPAPVKPAEPEHVQAHGRQMGPNGYIVVDQCPICGGTHVHTPPQCERDLVKVAHCQPHNSRGRQLYRIVLDAVPK